MTVTALSPRYATYAGDGGTGPFPIPFRFFAAAEIKAAVVGPDGGREPLDALAVEGAGEPTGGAATTPRAILAGETLVLWAETALVQPADYIAADAFPAETHEAALDRLTLIAQDQARDLARAVKVELGGTPPALGTRDELIADVAAEVGAEALAQVTAAGASEVAGAVATIGATKAAAVAEINQVASAQADALGFAGGGLFDVIPESAGFDGGFAVTDVNGWTIKSADPETNKYWFVAGVAGPVVRMRVPGVDWSGEDQAFRVYQQPQWYSTPTAVLSAAAAFLQSGKYIPNESSPTPPSGNLFALTTGDIRNTTSGVTITKQAALGPTGLTPNSAVQGVHTTTSAFRFLNDAIPPDTWDLTVKVKGVAAGTTNVRRGATASLTSDTVSDAVWKALPAIHQGSCPMVCWPSTTKYAATEAIRQRCFTTSCKVIRSATHPPGRTR